MPTVVAFVAGTAIVEHMFGRNAVPDGENKAVTREFTLRKTPLHLPRGTQTRSNNRTHAVTVQALAFAKVCDMQQHTEIAEWQVGDGEVEPNTVPATPPTQRKYNECESGLFNTSPPTPGIVRIRSNFDVVLMIVDQRDCVRPHTQAVTNRP